MSWEEIFQKFPPPCKPGDIVYCLVYTSCIPEGKEDWGIHAFYAAEMLINEEGEWGTISPFSSHKKLIFGVNVFTNKEEARKVRDWLCGHGGIPNDF